MKLSTYNFLTSKAIRGVKVGFPLKLTVDKRCETETEFNANFMERFIFKLDWPTVVAAAEVVGLSDNIPKQLNIEEVAGNQELLQKIHHLLMEIEILEGKLECPETGRIFPITDGIPNMLLNEDEV